MTGNLVPIKAALADLDEAHLEALIGASNHVPQIVPGFLTWISAAADWEINRRHGFEYELRPPEAAIPDDEDAMSIGAVIALRSAFAKESPAVRAVFDALVALLTGGTERKH